MERPRAAAVFMSNAVEIVDLKHSLLPHFTEILADSHQPNEVHFNADPIALKLVLHDEICLSVGIG